MAASSGLTSTSSSPSRPTFRTSAWQALVGAVERVVALEVFKKLPLGGLDRRALATSLASHGKSTAVARLAEQRALVRPTAAKIPEDVAILILGGSNGITRALAIQLLFGERAAVYGVHFDSEKLQIGFFHVHALVEAAAEAGLVARFWN